MRRSKRPASAAGTRSLTTVSEPFLRVFVIVHVTSSLESTVTPASDEPSPDWPLSHAMLESYLASVPLASDTVYEPGATLFEPESPSPATALTTSPPIFRSKRPGSSAGFRSLTTVSMPSRRVFVIVQTTSSLESTVTPATDDPSPDWPLSHAMLESYFASVPLASDTV